MLSTAQIIAVLDTTMISLLENTKFKLIS